MATVTTDFLAALFTKYSKVFEESFLAATRINDYKRLCTVMQSQTLTESLNWLGTVPQMRLWVDTRVHQAIAPTFTYSITNNHYEATVDVDQDTIEDDQYDFIQPRVSQLGLEAGRYPWVLTVNALTANGTCYDGQSFFSASHAEQASGTQNNTVSASGQTVSQIMTDIATAIARMRGFLDNQGRPMYLGMDGMTVLCGPALEQQFRQIAFNDYIVVSTGTGIFGQENNYLKGTFDLIVDPYITSTTAWYLFDLSQPIKPLIYIDRKAPAFVALTAPDSVQVFNNRMYSYGVDFRGNVGYGDWRFAVRVS